MYYEGRIDEMPQQLSLALIRAESLDQWPCYPADSDGGQAKPWSPWSPGTSGRTEFFKVGLE